MIQMQLTKLPRSLRSYFWDVEFERLETQKHQFLIIKRVLDRGKTDDIRWLLQTYSQDVIKEVLEKTRDLSQPTGKLWADILNLDYKKIVCLQKPYSPLHFGLYS